MHQATQDDSKGAVMAQVNGEGSRAVRLDRAIRDLLSQTSEIEAAAVVSFDGLPMASALPAGMDEDRVAAMSAALLSLGERATVGLGRGELSQVFIEGEEGTVFLVSADNEAVLVAVAAKGAKTGMMLYEVKRAAAAVADVLREPEPAPAVPAAQPVAQPAVPETPAYERAVPASVAAHDAFEALAAMPEAPAWTEPAPPAYAPLGTLPDANGSSWA
jgi:predicted regulator of Ras-like GTPase activity (Roadblock/LC7/MglB family)